MPAKYKCDSKHLADACTNYNIILIEKSMNRASVIPTLEPILSPTIWFWPRSNHHYMSFNHTSTLIDTGILFNTLRQRRNGQHFADYIFKCIFLNENVWIVIKFPLKFVPKDRFSNVPALVQIMAWRRPGDKPLSEPMMVSLLTHICIILPQWVKEVWEYIGIFITHGHWNITGC